MTAITSLTISNNFDSATGSDENDARQKQAAKRKLINAQPVMQQAERKMSEKLLSEAMGRSKQNNAADPSPASLLQRVSTSSKKMQQLQASPLLEVDQRLPAMKESLQDSMPRSSKQKEEEEHALASLSRHLGDIELNMLKIQRRMTPDEVLLQLNAMGDQLETQPRSLSVADKKHLKDMTCSLDFIEGYYEASSSSGNIKNSFAESLSRIRTALDESMLIIASQQTSAINSNQVNSQSNAPALVDSITSKELQKCRDVDQNTQQDNFSEMPNILSGIAGNSKKKGQSSAMPPGLEARSLKKQSDKDERRDDTLPLTTLRSI